MFISTRGGIYNAVKGGLSFSAHNPLGTICLNRQIRHG
jgi:hypothetical protein